MNNIVKQVLWANDKPHHGEIRILIDGEHWNELCESDAMKEIEGYIEALNYYSQKTFAQPEGAKDKANYITEEEPIHKHTHQKVDCRQRISKNDHSRTIHTVLKLERLRCASNGGTTMDRYEIRKQLLENARKMQDIFNVACENAETFEVTAYSERITDNYKAVLEDMRAEYEENAFENLSGKKEADV